MKTNEIIEKVVKKFIECSDVSYTVSEYGGRREYAVYFDDVFEIMSIDSKELFIKAVELNLEMNNDFLKLLKSNEEWLEDVEPKLREDSIVGTMVDELKYVGNELIQFDVNGKTAYTYDDTKSWTWLLGIMKIIGIYAEFADAFKKTANIRYNEAIKINDRDKELFEIIPHQELA